MSAVKTNFFKLICVFTLILTLWIVFVPIRAGAVTDESAWNKKTVTITVPNDYKHYTNTSTYTLKGVGVWQWGNATSDGMYSVYYDASDIKKMAYKYEVDLDLPARYTKLCKLRDDTEYALR